MHGSAPRSSRTISRWYWHGRFENLSNRSLTAHFSLGYFKILSCRTGLLRGARPLRGVCTFSCWLIFCCPPVGRETKIGYAVLSGCFLKLLLPFKSFDHDRIRRAACRKYGEQRWSCVSPGADDRNVTGMSVGSQ